LGLFFGVYISNAQPIFEVPDTVCVGEICARQWASGEDQWIIGAEWVYFSRALFIERFGDEVSACLYKLLACQGFAGNAMLGKINLVILAHGRCLWNVTGFPYSTSPAQNFSHPMCLAR